MSDDESLVSVVAHGLLNDVAVIQGLVAQARQQLEPNTPRNDRSDYLLQLAELKAITVVESLRQYVWGLSEDQSPASSVVDLAERRLVRRVQIDGS